MENDQYLDKPLDVNLNIYKSVLEKYVPQIDKFHERILNSDEKFTILNKTKGKPQYQFQELTKKLYPIYGAKIFTLPYRTFYSDYKLIKAHEKTEQFCKDKIPENRFKYLVSCMRKMPY